MDRQEKNKINKSKTILMDYRSILYMKKNFFNESIINTWNKLYINRQYSYTYSYKEGKTDNKENNIAYVKFIDNEVSAIY